MTREWWLDVLFILGTGGLALLLAGSARETAVVVVQPLALGLAVVFTVQCAFRFEPDNPVRRPWQLLGLGLVAWELGEISEAVYLLGSGEVDPFPSLADAFFVLAYPALIASFALFVRAYRASGMAPEEGGGQWVLVAALSAVGFVVLRPILGADVRLVERVVSAAYAGLDLVALVPLLLLLRLTWRLRGGSVWKVWAGVLFGLLLTFLGDVFFAYFQTNAEVDLAASADQLEFLANVMFLLSYVVLARGTLHQRELLRA